jgi:hypothetical protein
VPGQPHALDPVDYAASKAGTDAYRCESGCVDVVVTVTNPRAHKAVEGAVVNATVSELVLAKARGPIPRSPRFRQCDITITGAAGGLRTALPHRRAAAPATQPGHTHELPGPVGHGRLARQGPPGPEPSAWPGSGDRPRQMTPARKGAGFAASRTAELPRGPSGMNVAWVVRSQPPYGSRSRQPSSTLPAW